MSRRGIDFNLMDWKPVYQLDKLKFTVTERKEKLSNKRLSKVVNVLVVEVEGYHKQEYDPNDVYFLAEIYYIARHNLKPPDETNDRCKIIFEYLIDHALFPYPMEELA